MKCLKSISIFFFSILISLSVFSENSLEEASYSISLDTTSPLVGISNSKNYKVFANSGALVGFTPAAPDNYSNITGLLKVFPTSFAPIFDFNTPTQLFIRENQAVGQIVGQFASSLESKITTFHLVDGEGDSHNSLFSIDTNGSLKSAVVFDYESSEPLLSLRVRASDISGTNLEKIIKIQLINIIEDLDSDGIEDHLDEDADGDGFNNKEEIAYGSDPLDAGSIFKSPPGESIQSFRPIVKTHQNFVIKDGTLSLSGEIFDIGDSASEIIRGFILSKKPSARLDSANFQMFEEKGGVGTFTKNFALEDIPFHNFYFRTFAKNSEGTSYGAGIRVNLLSENAPHTWAEAMPVTDAEGWWKSSWFGSFYASDEQGWILHEDLSWIFVLPQLRNQGVWIWQSDLGWLWTGKSSFAYLFSHDSQSWIYLHGSSKEKLLLFDYLSNDWLVLKKS